MSLCASFYMCSVVTCWERADLLDRFSVDADQRYCRMFQEHSEILSTFIKLPFVFNTFGLSIFFSKNNTVKPKFSVLLFFMPTIWSALSSSAFFHTSRRVSGETG